MKIIKKLSEYISEEVSDAKKYAECAVKYKSEYPELSKLFLSLSGEEMGHMERLHRAVTELIEKYRREHGEPPAAMLAVWEYKHEEHIEAAEEVIVLQGMFKKG